MIDLAIKVGREKNGRIKIYIPQIIFSEPLSTWNLYAECHEKCSACCRNYTDGVQITDEEIEILKPNHVNRGKDFNLLYTKPCEFIKRNGKCSVYMDRPQKCRDFFCYTSDEKVSLPYSSVFMKHQKQIEEQMSELGLCWETLGNKWSITEDFCVSIIEKELNYIRYF